MDICNCVNCVNVAHEADDEISTTSNIHINTHGINTAEYASTGAQAIDHGEMTDCNADVDAEAEYSRYEFDGGAAPSYYPPITTSSTPAAAAV